MKITKIEIQKNNKEKVNIFIDGIFSFSLSINGLSKYFLYEGINITQEKIDEIKREDEGELAFIFLLNKISYKMHTEKEIIDKLKSKEFSDESINYAIEKGKEYKYIDDNYYTKCFIEQRALPNKWGENIIYQKLLLKGINKDIIKEGINLYFKEDIEFENCLILAEKKLNSIKEEDIRKKKDKLYRFLISKGYSFDVINKCFLKLLEESITPT